MKRVGGDRVRTAGLLLLSVIVVALPTSWLASKVLAERRAKAQYFEMQHASFAAEAGLEAARVYVSEVCADAAQWAQLLESSATHEVAMPGQEGSLTEFFGYTLPGDGSVVVRLRAARGRSGAEEVTVRSTGNAGSEERLLTLALTCSEARSAVRGVVQREDAPVEAPP